MPQLITDAQKAALEQQNPGFTFDQYGTKFAKDPSGFFIQGNRGNIPSIPEGSLVQFSDITGLEGFPNLFKLQGKQFIPQTQGATGPVTQVQGSARGVSQFGFGIAPMGERVGPLAPTSQPQQFQAAAQPPTPAQRLTTGTQPTQPPQFARGTTPQGKSRAEVGQDVLGTLGGKNANQNFVNAVFQAFHGRDATRDELGLYTGQTVETVRNAIMKGAQAAGQTSPTADQPQPTQPLTTKQPDFQAAIQPKEEDAFTKLKDYLGLSDLQKQETDIQNTLVEAQRNLKTRYDSLQEELEARGLSEISKKIGDISRDALAQEQALRALPETKKAAVAPFKVTAAQLERLTAIDRSKIAQGLSDLVRLQSTYEAQYTREYQRAKDAAEAGVEGAENALKALGLQVQFAADKRERAEQALKDYAKTLTENKKLKGEIEDTITYAEAVKSGYMDITEVPADIRGHVLTEIANPGTFTTDQYNITAIAEGTNAPTTNRPLTPAEQNTLKVPSGVNTKSVFGLFGTRRKGKATGGPAPVLPKGFDDDIRRAQDLIDSGRSDWGQEWNGLRLRYPNVTADKIDAALGPARRIAGYYEELGRKQEGAKGPPEPTSFSVQQETLTNISNLLAAGRTTRSEVEQAIRLKGFDPNKEPWKGLVSDFPKKIVGRTFWQKLIPGGK